MSTSIFTSTTAPGKIFRSRSELAEHYKSDWHKYNLKRREAGLPLLKEDDFQARWEAALALKKEKEAKAHSGTDHIKASKKKKKKGTNENSSSTENKNIAASQENPTIEPRQCLFDPHMSDSLEENVTYMEKKFGFFIPDREFLVDLEGLLGYCHEKIKLGHYCLYCEKMFPTWRGCQNHMISCQHTKLRYDKGFWAELDPFYDFKKDDERFLGESKLQVENSNNEENASEDNDDGWEDMSEGDAGGSQDDDEEMYDIGGYEKEIARFGLDVTPLGELVFPDGRIVGHRALRRYYNQRLRPVASSDAVRAAKHAAGERLYEGQVVNVRNPLSREKSSRAGKGILVPLKDGAEGFSALSLYRYRAAIKKKHIDDDKGRRLKYRTSLNINRMDKKANRLMNGVSVAHAKR